MEAWTYVVTGLIFLVGLLIGAVLGFNGFGQPATPGAIGQSPRIKNLLWLFSGFLPALMLDFQKLGLPTDYPLYWPVGGYGVGAVLGALGAVGWTIHSITKSARNFNTHHRSVSPIDAGDLQREYLTYGKNRFEERWKEQRDKALATEERIQAAAEADRKAAEANATTERREAAATEERRRLDLEADKVVARCVFAVLAHLASPEADRRPKDGDLIDAIMDAILKVVSVHGGNRLVLRGSYMTYIPSSAAASFRDQALFTRDMPDRYLGYLALRRGGGLAMRNVVLPIATDANCTFPGAPEAVAVMGVAMMNLREIGFRSEVSPEARKEIQEFFRAPYFESIASVTSLVIQNGDVVHGVMNIESSVPDLLGKGLDAAQTVLARLQPLNALLSVFRLSEVAR